MFSQPLSFYTINLNVIQENEFLQFLNHKVPMVTPIEMKQEQVRSNPKLGSCEDEMKTSRSFQLGHSPNWTGPARRMAELAACSIQLGHPSSWTDSARRMAKLVACSIQLGHPPNWTGSARTSSARRMAELVTCSIQLGHPPNWTGLARWIWSRVRSSSAIRQAGLVQLGGWPSWSRGQTSSAIRRAGLVQLGGWPRWSFWSIQLGHPPSWTVCSVHPSIKRA
ncbi:hypothetical protein DY000_02039783 [Brassica cretica]|uniref:Uncharacterized protein n=1 Tax=Brassica cretica TaxID=69181 RepID=A0ABQ7BJK9_BRACR|nr:hypothetical protein DY000_02039783 [Brassica cretica]